MKNYPIFDIHTFALQLSFDFCFASQKPNKGNPNTEVTIFTGYRHLNTMPEVLAQNQKKIDKHFNPLFKEKKLLILKICINNVCVKIDCASDNEKIIFYICEFIEYYLIKGSIF
jgi:hypothetical protein